MPSSRLAELRRYAWPHPDGATSSQAAGFHADGEFRHPAGADTELTLAIGDRHVPDAQADFSAPHA